MQWTKHVIICDRINAHGQKKNWTKFRFEFSNKKIVLKEFPKIELTKQNIQFIDNLSVDIRSHGHSDFFYKDMKTHFD